MQSGAEMMEKLQLWAILRLSICIGGGTMHTTNSLSPNKAVERIKRNGMEIDSRWIGDRADREMDEEILDAFNPLAFHCFATVKLNRGLTQSTGAI